MRRIMLRKDEFSGGVWRLAKAKAIRSALGETATNHRDHGGHGENERATIEGLIGVKMLTELMVLRKTGE